MEKTLTISDRLRGQTQRQMETVSSPLIIISLKVIVEVKWWTAVQREEWEEFMWGNMEVIASVLSKSLSITLWLTCTCLQLSVWWFLTCVVWVLQPGWCLLKKTDHMTSDSVSSTFRSGNHLPLHYNHKWKWWYDVCAKFDTKAVSYLKGESVHLKNESNMLLFHTVLHPTLRQPKREPHWNLWPILTTENTF